MLILYLANFLISHIYLNSVWLEALEFSICIAYHLQMVTVLYLTLVLTL